MMLSLLLIATTAMASQQFTVETALVAVDKQDPEAFYFLAKCFAKGQEGLPQNYTNAAKLLQKAAEKGCVAAQNDLGACYAKGLGVQQDYKEAAKWYLLAAEEGDELAQYSLGRAYWLGCGVPTNLPSALKWLKRAARQNQPDAMFVLGKIYQSGAPGLKADGRQAFRWFVQAADHGRSGALYPAGKLLEEGSGVPRNLLLAVNCYQRAAEAGDTQAMLRLSELNMPGSNLPAPDIVEAFKWLRVAADQGDGYAHHLTVRLPLDGVVSGAQSQEGSRRAEDFESAFGIKPVAADEHTPAQPAPMVSKPVGSESRRDQAGEPTQSATTHAAAADSAGPRIQFDSTVFDFGRVMAGELVPHEFYFTNTGSGDLILTNVRPHCGCTTAGEWTHQVKAGGSGVVPILFDSANLDTLVTKGITVSCNDISQPDVTLQLKGVVWKGIDIIPSAVTLNLLSEAPFRAATVRITNTLDQPLLLSTPESTNQFFGAELQTNSPGKDYSLVISNTAFPRPLQMQTQATVISMKTSLTNLPVLSVMAYALITPELAVLPAQITLPPAPLPANKLDWYVLVSNNSTNPVTLSDLAVSAKDLQVKTQMRQEGLDYAITLSFPPNTDLASGQPIYLTAKTSNPNCPEIKVPIYQSAPRASGQTSL
jgi:TPR repeat protein